MKAEQEKSPNRRESPAGAEEETDVRTAANMAAVGPAVQTGSRFDLEQPEVGFCVLS